MYLLLSAASEPEPSKVAFYICGGLLAAWAVLVSALGMSRRDFPATVAARRGVITVSVLLVTATLTSVVITS